MECTETFSIYHVTKAEGILTITIQISSRLPKGSVSGGPSHRAYSLVEQTLTFALRKTEIWFGENQSAWEHPRSSSHLENIESSAIISRSKQPLFRWEPNSFWWAPINFFWSI